MDLDAVILSRIQFAFIISFHIISPAFIKNDWKRIFASSSRRNGGYHRTRRHPAYAYSSGLCFPKVYNIEMDPH